MERQKHGFLFEQTIIEGLSLIKTEKYTSHFDAFDKDGTPYQIKCIKKNSSIDMSDFFRNSNIKQDFVLIIGFWENKKTNIVEVKKLRITHEKWKHIFSGFEKKEELKDWITNRVSNDRSYDKQWRKEIKMWKQEYGNRLIKIRFKRDHKKQRRIQCAINKTDFYNYFVPEFAYE